MIRESVRSRGRKPLDHIVVLDGKAKMNWGEGEGGKGQKKPVDSPFDVQADFQTGITIHRRRELMDNCND